MVQGKVNSRSKKWLQVEMRLGDYFLTRSLAYVSEVNSAKSGGGGGEGAVGGVEKRLPEWAQWPRRL